MKKILSTMFAALAILTVVSCGKDNDSKDNSGGGSGSNTSNMSGTIWYAIDGDLQSGNYTGYGLTFSTQNICGLVVVTAANGEETEDAYLGSYTYSNGRGTINLMDTTMTIDRGTATFTVNGDNLTLVFNGKTIVMSKTPAPFPGGEDPEDPEDPTPSHELDNTYWNYIDGDPEADNPETVTYYNVVIAGGMLAYTVRTEDPHAEDPVEETYFGTYTYANGSGSVALKNQETMQDAGTATFTIDSDVTMAFTFRGETIILDKMRY